MLNYVAKILGFSFFMVSALASSAEVNETFYSLSVLEAPTEYRIIRSVPKGDLLVDLNDFKVMVIYGKDILFGSGICSDLADPNKEIIKVVEKKEEEEAAYIKGRKKNDMSGVVCKNRILQEYIMKKKLINNAVNSLAPKVIH